MSGKPHIELAVGTWAARDFSCVPTWLFDPWKERMIRPTSGGKKDSDRLDGGLPVWSMMWIVDECHDEERPRAKDVGEIGGTVYSFSLCKPTRRRREKADRPHGGGGDALGGAPA